VYICAGEIEQFEFAQPVGIGMVDTAVNLTKICLDNAPEEIIFVGTAGSYGSVGLFEIVESYHAVTIENSFFTAGAYSPIVSRETSLYRNKKREEELIVNSSNYITTDEKIAQHYLKNKIEIENMEFFSVMRTAKLLGIPAKGVFIVTNYCNTRAHQDFLTHHKEAMQRLSHYMNTLTKE